MLLFLKNLLYSVTGSGTSDGTSPEQTKLNRLSDMDTIGNLPVEITVHIFSYLDGKDLWRCLSLSKNCRIIANDNKFWYAHCKYVGIDLDPEELKPSDNGFNLCSAAQEWRNAHRRALSWRTNNTADLLLTSFLLGYHKSTILLLEDTQLVFLYDLSSEGLKYLDKIEIPESSSLINRTLVSGEINSKFIVINTLEIVIVHSGLSSGLTFQVALGIKDGRLVQVSQDIPGYFELRNRSSMEFSFEPVCLCRDSLLVILNHASLRPGPMFMVNLLKKEIIEIAVPFQHTVMIPSKDYLYFARSKQTAIVGTDGEICYESSDFDLNCNNDNYIAEIRLGELHICKLSTKESIRIPIDVDPVSYILVPPNLDYVFLLSIVRRKIVAYNLRDGEKVWEKELMRFVVFDVVIRVISGLVAVCCIRPDDSASKRIFGVFDAKTGKEHKINDIKEYDYFIKKKVNGRLYLRYPL